MKTEKYNGWRNWETWNLALWLGNDEGLYRCAIERRESLPRRRFNATTAREFCNEVFPGGTPDMRIENLREDDPCEMSCVHWPEIASAMNEF